MAKALVTGSRLFEDLSLVRKAMVMIANQFDELLVGDARGVDKVAHDEWEKLTNKPSRVFPAEWDKYGRAAGMIRNADMVRLLTPNSGDRVFGFWDGKSSGTKGCMELAKQRGIPVMLVDLVKEGEGHVAVSLEYWNLR